MENEGITKNTFYNVIKSCSQIVFPLITFPYISRVLLTENVGKISFGNSVVSYFSLIASLGINNYAIREGAKVKRDKNRLSEVSGQIISINLVTTILSYMLLLVTLLFASSLENYRLLIIIQSASILFTTLGADWLNTVMEDFKYITVRTVLFQIFSLAAMFLFVRKPEDYLKYAFICVLASSGANLVNIFYRQKYSKVSFTMHMDMKNHMPHILMLFATVLSQTIYCNSDITMLGLFRGDYEVGLYSTAVKIYTIIKTILISIIWVIVPKLSYYFSRKDYVEINKLLRYALNFIIVFGFPCVIGINVITSEIIEIVAGKEYLGAVTSLHILSIAIIFSLLAGFFGNAILFPSVREKIFLKACILGAAINVITNFIFIPFLGLNAAAFTTVISEFIVFLIALLHIEKEINFGSFKDILLAPGIGGIGIAVVSVVCSKVIQQLWIKAITIIILSVTVYTVTLLLLKNKFALNLIGILKNKLNDKQSDGKKKRE